jgi:hypothetical protein
MLLIREFLIIFHYKLQKKLFKNSFIRKNYFGEKRNARLMKNNACGSFDLILTQIDDGIMLLKC